MNYLLREIGVGQDTSNHYKDPQEAEQEFLQTFPCASWHFRYTFSG